MSTEVSKSQNKLVKKILKGRNLAKPIEGTKFWVVEPKEISLEAKVYKSAAGNLYLKLHADDKDDQAYINAGGQHGAVQTFEKGDIVDAVIVFRVPNPELTDEDIERTFDSISKRDGEASAKAAVAGIKQARENDEESILLVNVSDIEEE